MRALPSVASADNYAVLLGAAFFDAASVNYATFSHDALAGLSGLSWEVPLYGGVSKPSNYTLDLLPGAAWISAHRQQLTRSEVRLTVQINSDAFQAHVGRIRGYTQDGDNPNKLTLNVYDRFLDADPLVPEIAIVDSWSTPHLEELATGYPLVYGKGYRPSFFTAVTCDLSTLLGPRNVSSANHTGSLWFCSDLSKGGDVTSGFQNILFNAVWQQQSGALNVVSNGTPFEIMDGGPNHAQRFWKQEFRSGYTTGYVNVNTFTGLPASAGVIAIISDNLMTAQAEYEHFPLQAGHFLALNQHIAPIIPQKIRFVSHVKIQSTVVQSVAAGRGCDLTIRVSSGVGYGQTFIGSAFAVMSLDYDGPWSAYNNDGGMEAHPLSAMDGSTDTIASALYYTNPDDPGQIYSITSKLSLRVQVDATGYKRYSVFAPQVSSADIAISTNPMAILDDIFSHHTSVPYRQDLSSATQVAIQSLQFNALFDVRQAQSQVIDDFAQTCGFYAWAGDSGMVQTRAFVESASAVTNRTLTTSDIVHAALNAAPLGTTIYQGAQAGRLTVQYAFDYQLNKYGASAVATKATNGACNSAYNAGVQKEQTLSSKYIMDSDTASYALGNLVRKYAYGQEYIILDLPLRHAELELADVIRVKHPIVPSSDALYQITRVEADYLGGALKITAGRLQSLSA